MTAQRQRALEQLLVEASDNDKRKVAPGTVTLAEDGIIDWAEKTKYGLVARTGLVHWPTFWHLVDEALAGGDRGDAR